MPHKPWSEIRDDVSRETERVLDNIRHNPEFLKALEAAKKLPLGSGRRRPEKVEEPLDKSGDDV
jgi:hypothetical protein